MWFIYLPLICDLFISHWSHTSRLYIPRRLVINPFDIWYSALQIVNTSYVCITIIIKIISTYTRLGQIGSTSQAATPWCRLLLAKSTDHWAFALTSLCQCYPKLARETAATEQQRPASQLPILQCYITFISIDLKGMVLWYCMSSIT